MLEKILLLTPLLLPLATAIFLNFVGKYMKVNQIALVSSLGLLGSFSATFILFVLLAVDDFHSYTFEYYQFISRGIGASTHLKVLFELLADGCDEI